MQIIIDLFNLVFLQPIVNLLVTIIRFLQSLGIPGVLGFSIIILTILIRLLIWKLISTQLKSAKKMSDLKPHLDELKRKHKDDKQTLLKAQQELYKEHGVNPAGGCLPALVQIPVLIALYQSILAFFNGENGLNHINSLLYPFVAPLDKVPDPHFFGIDLTIHPAQFTQGGVLLLAIPIITAVLTFAQSKMMTPATVKQYPSDSPKEKKEKEGMEDAMSAVQGQMVFMMPLMVGYFAFQFPVALALYWNTLTLIGIFQQYSISGWGGLRPWMKFLGVSKELGISTDLKSSLKK